MHKVVDVHLKMCLLVVFFPSEKICLSEDGSAVLVLIGPVDWSTRLILLRKAVDKIA